MKTKRLAQRILSAVFSLATLLSISTISFASSGFEGKDPNGNGQSTGNNGYGTNDTYETGFSLNDQGFRLSLVNNDGTVHNNSVADLEIARNSNWRLTDTVNAQIGNSTATDPNSAGQRINDPILIDKNVPKAIRDGGGTFVGNGEAVKAWAMEKDGNNKANILALVEKSFPGIDDETKSKIISGEIKVELEPLLQMPIYNGNTFTGERVLATPRDYLAMLRERYPAGAGYSDYARMGGYMKPVLKAALQSMFLQNEDLGLEAMSKEAMDKYIEWFILNGDLSKIGAGLFIFDLGDKTPPPQQPQQPQTSSGNIDITESRITRHKKLSDVDKSLRDKEFEWDVPAFTNEDCSTSSCHCGGKDITDPSNTLYIDEMNKPGQNEGVVKENLWTAIDDSTNKKDYTRSTWDNDTIKLSGVEYSITVVRLKDQINFPTYRKTGNESAIVGFLKCVGSGNSSTARSNTPQTSFDISLLFKDDGKGEYKTTSSHTDYKNTTPKATTTNPNPQHTHRKSGKTNTQTTKPLTELQMTLHIKQYNYAGKKNTSSSTQAKGLTQHYNYGKQETWLELNYGTVSFYPYVRMQFDTVTKQGAQVYVAGKYSRSFTANEYVGIIFTTSKNTGHSIVNTNFGGVKGKISLQSSQWSTHATAVKNAGSNCVLPGGAVLDLAILKDDRQTFTVESIKPILAGSGLNQVNATKTNIIELQCVY